MMKLLPGRKLEAVVIPIAAVATALLLFGIFCAIAGANPFGVYASIYRAAFGSWYAWQNTLIRAAPLMLTALCTVLPARIGLVVIGNEGALIVGGVAAVAVGLALSAAPLVVLVAMAGAGIVAGGVWIAIVGALRHYRGVNETISSLLLNYIAIALMNQLVEGPMRDPSSLNRPATHPLLDPYRLGELPGTRVHYGLLYGLVACLIAYFLISRTTFGFAARTVGGNVRAAQIAGLSVGKLTLAICFLAGSCAGLAGMVEVAAVHGRVSEALNANYGYSGILVAFVARHSPLATGLVAVLLGGILASGGILQRAHELPDATVLVFQGLVFLVILFSESLYGRWSSWQENYGNT
ncbi:MAG: ABC transporter permease [Cyanophyceae cyanobacterium]